MIFVPDTGSEFRGGHDSDGRQERVGLPIPDLLRTLMRQGGL